MAQPLSPEYLVSAHKRAVHQALQRGRDKSLLNTALYLPGEEVRCPRLRYCKELARDEVCGIWLFTNGPDSSVLVRQYDPRAFRNGRGSHRANMRCNSRGCHAQLEVEFVAL